MFEKLKEEQIASEKVYSGVLLQVYRDKVKLVNGETSVRELIRHVGAVCVVALTENDEVIIERQFRYPFDTVLTEIPAGKLDSAEEDPLEAAKRELREETGYTADHWEPLGIYYPTVAYTDEKIWIFLARGLHKGERQLDPDEFLNYGSRPLSELLDEVMDGKIVDGKTQLGILKTARRMGL